MICVILGIKDARVKGRQQTVFIYDVIVKSRQRCMLTYKLLSGGLTRQTPTIILEVSAGLRKLHRNGAIRGISLGKNINR